MKESDAITVPSSWALSRVGEVCTDIKYGYTASASSEPNGPRFLRITDIQNGKVQWESVPYCAIDAEQLPKYALKPGDIVFARTGGTVGKSFLITSVPEAAVFASYLIRLSAHAEILPKFLYYFFQSGSYWEQIGIKKGGLQGNVNATTLASLELPICPYDEQARIVGKIEEHFSELDKGVESLKTARQQLQVYRQALLKHAFEGKLTAQWRKKNARLLEPGSRLLSRINDERRTRYESECRERAEALSAWETSGQRGRRPPKPIEPTEAVPIDIIDTVELPKLPHGWLWLRYGDLCDLVRNGVSQKPDGTDGAKIFRISAVRPMEFDLGDFRYLKNSNGEYNSYYLATGDLVFTRYNGSRAYVGVCAEYKGNGEHLFPDKLIQTRVLSPFASSSFLEKALNCGASRRFVETKIRTTAGQSGISGTDVKSIPVPICGAAEQAIIEERLGSDLTKVAYLLDAIETALERTEALRQSVLKKAFSGKLVEQDPDDEPSSILLDRIKGERADRQNGKDKNKRRHAA